MTITRANVESILVARVGPLMTKADLATTVAGSNADLNDPIGWGLRQADYTVADITSVADTDLASVAVADYDEVISLSELRLLRTILMNLDDVDTTLGPRSEKLSQLAAQVQRRIDRLSDELEAEFGVGASALSVGKITQLFAEHES